MIKINVVNAKDIEVYHKKALKELVKSKIKDKQSKEKPNSALWKFLDFLDKHIDTLLCGEKAELEKLITDIEKDHYISERKLSSIRTRRKSKLKGDKKIKEGISVFIADYNLAGHLPSPYHHTKIDDFNKAVKGLTKEKWEGYTEVLKEIFNYDDFTKIKKWWSAYTLVEHTGITVCPYCNRSFVTTIRPEKKRNTEEDDKKTRAVLDHYFAKGLYPYLALSLYNLIPSCNVCNSSFKGEIDFYDCANEAIYPYKEDFLNLVTFETDFVGETAPYDYKYLLGDGKAEFKINLKIREASAESLQKKAEVSIKTFALEKLYNTHLDIVRDLIRNGIVNNKSRIDELYDNESLRGLFSSREEIIQSLFVNYVKDDDLGKRPFAKLTQDICKELGLLGPPK